MTITADRRTRDSRRRVDDLATQLQSLESQVGRLTDLLSEQVVIRNRRRRRLTLRVLLSSFVFFALAFAWFGRVFHESRRQAAAVDRQIDQGAFVMYSRRDSALVSLMPGDPDQPPGLLVDRLGDDFFRAVTNVSTGTAGAIARDKNEVMQAVADLKQLRRLRLTHLQLNTSDLNGLAKLSDLQSLDLSRTRLDPGSIRWVGGTQMRWFNASHTWLGDRALYDLSQCPELQQLHLERTSVTDAGLEYLKSATKLRYLNLKRCPVTLAAVQSLSKALPGCVIDWEPLQFLPTGQVDRRAAARGRVRLGKPLPADPRASRQVAPPLDNPVVIPDQVQFWRASGMTRTIPATRGGYILDSF